jgi:hypothetical protein
VSCPEGLNPQVSPHIKLSHSLHMYQCHGVNRYRACGDFKRLVEAFRFSFSTEKDVTDQESTGDDSVSCEAQQE